MINIQTFQQYNESNKKYINNKYLVKYLDGSGFEHETEIDAKDETEVKKKIEKEHCRNATDLDIKKIK